MTVLIPHPTEQLILAQMQHSILILLNSNNFCWYPQYPLWVQFDNQNMPCIRTIKQMSVQFSIKKAQIKNEILFFPATLKLNDSTIRTGKIIFGKKRSNALKIRSEEIPETAEIQYPLTCRVFRAADAVFYGCSWKVIQSTWVKTTR
jgi:hypothetical protein